MSLSQTQYTTQSKGSGRKWSIENTNKKKNPTVDHSYEKTTAFFHSTMLFIQKNQKKVNAETSKRQQQLEAEIKKAEDQFAMIERLLLGKQ